MGFGGVGKPQFAIEFVHLISAVVLVVDFRA